MRRLLRFLVALCGAAPVVAAWTAVGLAVARSDLESPPPTLLLTDREGRFLAEVGTGDPDEDHGFWAVDPLPDRVVAATLALEDRRFWDHPGVDGRALARALLQDLAAGEVVSGASTLAMQVARMQDPGPRTVPRKAVEALTALLLTARHGRGAVLAHYLRIVPYGNRVRGIGYAARRYLDKPVDDLSWAEVAFLCAIPQAPGRANPYRAEGRAVAVARAGRILDALHARGLLSETDLAQARLDLAALRVPERGVRPEAALHAIARIEAEISADADLRERLARHPVVRTSLDLDLQARVETDLALDVAGWEAAGAGNGAVVVVDRATREVRAWVGSTGYLDRRHAGAIDYARVPRLAGSTLKPFLYALALERGVITPATVLEDVERAPRGIGNADERFLGPLLPRRALAASRNVPAVTVLRRLGQDRAWAFLGDLGLHDGRSPASRHGLAVAVGGVPVTLEALVRASTVLAGDGRLGDLTFFPDLQLEPPRRILSEATARQVTLFLSDPLARLPVFPRLGTSEYPFPVALKTGTSSDYRDAWTVAWSREVVVGAWVGHPDWRPMKGLGGYQAGARVAREVIEALHAGDLDGLSDLSFPAPEGYERARVCALSGRLAGPDCPDAVPEWFPPGQVPIEPCDVHRAILVDARTGTPATGRTPRRHVEQRRYAALPARYAAWAARHGLVPPPPGLGGGRVSAPGLAPEETPRIEVTTPEDGLRVLPDPEAPGGLSTLALGVAVDPPVPQVVWTVDGRPFATVEAPYQVRWPLARGTHEFQARVPFTDLASSVVRVVVE